MKRYLILFLTLVWMIQPTLAAQNAVELPTSGPLPGMTAINDVNAAMATVETINSGTTAPTAAGLGLTGLAGVMWHDTTTNTIKIRDQADANWIVLFQLDETSKVASGLDPVLASAAAQGVGTANHYASFIATGSATYTLSATSTLYNGFGFDVFAQGGAVTIAINASDKINGGTAGSGIVVPVGYSASFVTDAGGNWWVNVSPAVLGTATLASAATTDLGSVAAPAITVSGGTGIGSFGASAQAGQVKIVTFSAALTLTYNATSLITPTGSSITTAAGDSLMALALGSGNWRVVNYTKADGTALATSGSLSVPVRQTVLSGDTNFITTGSGLTPAFTATKPLVMTFANGFGSSGAVDLVSVLSAGGSMAAVPANNTSFLYATYVSATSVTWGYSLSPPQYGASYDQTQQSSLSLNNVSTDDFGNSWTNTSVTFANTSPQIASTSYGVFNGTSGFMQSTNVNIPANGSWTVRMWMKTATPTTSMVFFNSSPSTSGYWGAMLQTYPSTGKVGLYLSSNGSSSDIAAGTQGALTLSANTWYYIELTRDAVAGKYYVYVNGVLDQTVTSSAVALIGPVVALGKQLNVGVQFAGNIQGFEFLPYCQHPNGTTYSVPTTLPGVSNGGDWYDTVAAQMKSVTGAGPTFTAVNRAYVGEAVAGASSITSVTAYAFQRQYVSAWTAGLPSASVALSFADNLGTNQKDVVIEVKNSVSELGYLPGDIAPVLFDSGNSGTANMIPPTTAKRRNSVVTMTGSSGAMGLVNNTTGATTVLTAANWAYRARIKGNY